MLADLRLPEDVALVRKTPEFTALTVPPALLAAHQVASGVWGRLRVLEGSVTFVVEDTRESRQLGPGDTQIIEPAVVHHVEPVDGSRFCIEFHR